jgi:hypothetical protein
MNNRQLDLILGYLNEQYKNVEDLPDQFDDDDPVEKLPRQFDDDDDNDKNDDNFKDKGDRSSWRGRIR